MTNSNPVTLHELQEVENNIEIATKALADAAITAKELRIMMEERVPKVIKWVFESASSPQAAVKDLLGMGYTEEEMCQCGYSVD